jgi:hypothetical protein
MKGSVWLYQGPSDLGEKSLHKTNGVDPSEG